jgi:hypothetical protein
MARRDSKFERQFITQDYSVTLTNSDLYMPVIVECITKNRIPKNCGPDVSILAGPLSKAERQKKKIGES